MNIFGIGLPEMILILVVALLIFGPKKLPEIGSSLGKALRGFQDATKDFENEFKREVKKLEEEKPATPNSVAAVSEDANPEEKNSKTEIS
jgi:sec-independent protein translocase protein TatA